MANRFVIDIQAVAKGFSKVKRQISGQLQAGLDSSAESVNRLNAKLERLEAEYAATQKTLERVSAFKKLKADTAALGAEWQSAQERIEALAREIKTTDGPAGQLKRSFNSQYNENQAALEQMRRSLSSAGIDTKSLGAAQKQLEGKLNATQAEIRQTGAAFNAARKPTANFFTRARSGVNAFTERLHENRRAASGWSTALKGAIAAIGIREVVSGLWSAAREGQNLNIAFKSITGSAALAQNELNFIRKTSKDLKLEFYATAKGYKNIYAAAKDTPLKGEIRDIFLSVAEASAALRMSQDDTNGVLRAFSQIISKGKVQAEELRGQIGERLPGAFQLAADSMGITTAELDKLLEQGKVTANDLLPNLAQALHDKYGAAARDAASDTENMAGAANEFSTAWKDMLIQIGKSGFIQTATQTLNRLTASLKDPETQQSVTELTSMIFSLTGAVIEITAKYGKWILMLGGGA